MKNIYFALFLFMFIFSDISKGQELSEIKALIKSIELSHLARREMLQYSKGKARLTLDSKKSTYFEQYYNNTKEQFKNKKFQVVPMVGKAKWEVKWYEKEDRHRQDILLKEEDIKGDTFALPDDTSIAYNSERSLAYDRRVDRACIYHPPSPVTDVAKIYRNFDLDYFYDSAFAGVNKPLSEYMLSQESKGIHPDIKEVYENNERLIKVTYDLSKEHEGRVHKVKRIFNVAPEKSYSVVSYKVFSNAESGFEEMMLMASYEAVFEELTNYKKIWYLKNVHIFHRQRILEFTLNCDFENVAIDFDIPDEYFTFEGFGVPPGTRVEDKTLMGQPLRYFYKSYPPEKINKIDELLAKEISNKSQRDKESIEYFIPNANYVLENNKPYIFDLKTKKKIVTSYDYKNTINDFSENYIVWDNSIIVGKQSSLKIIKGNNIYITKENNKKFNTYRISDEFELPAKFVLNSISEKCKHVFTINKIIPEGIWITFDE